MSDNAWSKLRKIEAELNRIFYEREDVIRGLLIGLISRQHVIILGPPGEGKTDIITELCSRIVDANFFHRLVGKTSTPEDFAGPVSVKKYLEEESYEYAIKGKLPEANVAFLDEIFKGNTAVLNLQLDVMEYRRFFNGAETVKVPLHMLVGASNELPEDGEGLEALWDRFSLRYTVRPIISDKNFEQLLLGADGLGSAKSENTRTTITLAEVEQLQREVRAVKFGQAGANLLLQTRQAMKELKLLISTRKYARQAVVLMKAHALLDGRDEVDNTDLSILSHCFWNEEDQYKVIAKAIRKLSKSMNDEAFELRDASIEAFAAFLDADKALKENDTDQNRRKKQDVARETNKKLKGAMDTITQLIEQAKAGGRSTDNLQQVWDHINSMNASVVNYFLGWDTSKDYKMRL